METRGEHVCPNEGILKGSLKEWKGVQAANKQVADMTQGQRERVGSHAQIGAKHIKAYQME